MQARSAVHDVFVKDYVSCLSMPGRHTLEVSGASAPTLLRGRGRDGKRLARGDAETACRAAVVEPTHIRDLEDEVGVQLLERTPKSVRLTDAGRAFLDEERAILKHTDDAVQKVRVIGGDASTAADALRTAEDNRADLVLMDIQLDGGISGVAAAAAIRGHLDVPVVFLTAHASAETVAGAVESGAFGYLLKPYTVPELKSAIGIALHKHKSETALRRALNSRMSATVAQPYSTWAAQQRKTT